ncbi:MAG: DUF368 domain-containing protein [Clostridiales bacterium]|nr:DUF368 domain-containing protein [Clostridiales bacterium]
MDTVILILKGMLMGVANIIPGVSGGTIAVVLHIFDPLIEAVNNFYRGKENFKKYFRFICVLYIGRFAGIGIFSKLIKYCLESYSFPTCMFFVGLVVGSIPLIYGKAKEKEIKPKYFIAAAIGFLIVIGMSLLKEPEAAAAANTVSIGFFFKMLICTVISSAVMVIPGISGSFVMVLLGTYTTVITAISDLIDAAGAFFVNIGSIGFVSAAGEFLSCSALYIIIAVCIGAVIGILSVAKLIEILFKKAYSYTYFAILGLVLGSVISLLTDTLTYQSYPEGMGILPVVWGVVTLAAGVVISLFLGGEK